VVEKAAWKNGALQMALFEPFEILRHPNQESYRKEGEQWVRARLANLAPQKTWFSNHLSAFIFNDLKSAS
jgi:hypothetical protein